MDELGESHDHEIGGGGRCSGGWTTEDVGGGRSKGRRGGYEFEEELAEEEIVSGDRVAACSGGREKWMAKSMGKPGQLAKTAGSWETDDLPLVALAMSLQIFISAARPMMLTRILQNKLISDRLVETLLGESAYRSFSASRIVA